MLDQLFSYDVKPLIVSMFLEIEFEQVKSHDRSQLSVQNYKFFLLLSRKLA